MHDCPLDNNVRCTVTYHKFEPVLFKKEVAFAPKLRDGKQNKKCLLSS